VSRLRFLGVDNFVSVWQTSAHPSSDDDGSRSLIDPSFGNWYPGNDVVDWIGSSYFSSDRHCHDALLNFARRKRKPVIIAEAAPQGFDLELGTKIDIYTNEEMSGGLTGRDIWHKWFKPFFKYISDNRDVIRAVAYINTPWKTQRMWATGNNGYWGDSRIQVWLQHS